MTTETHIDTPEEVIRRALERLERAATEVARYGAATGPRWTKLSNALIGARGALMTKPKTQAALPKAGEVEPVAFMYQHPCHRNALSNCRQDLGEGWTETALGPIVPSSVVPAAAVEVKKIETVTGDFMQEPGEPFWRIEINGYCADFDHEQAARNFAAQITSSEGITERYREAEKLLAAIKAEADRGNEVIRLNRHRDGQGMITVATAMHRIADWSAKALATPKKDAQ